jgi:hypothetical protein
VRMREKRCVQSGCQTYTESNQVKHMHPHCGHLCPPSYPLLCNDARRKYFEERDRPNSQVKESTVREREREKGVGKGVDRHAGMRKME